MIESLQAELEAARAALAEKDQIIAKLQRMLFGKSSEKYVLSEPPPPSDQMDLFAPGEDPALPTAEEMKEEAGEAPASRSRKSSRKPIPSHLRRLDVQIDIRDEEKLCPCCGKPRVRIGEDVTERLKIIPQQLYVERILRPRYGCGACKDAVMQAPLPPTPLPRSAASASILAWLLISKYEDHSPLCRQERIMERLGIELSRSKTSGWLMDLADLLAPLTALMRRLVREKSAVIGADETPLDVMNGKGKTIRQGWLWVYRGDEGAPYTIFDFHESRGAASPTAMLADYTGFLVSDGYAVYPSVNTTIARNPGKGFVQTACWAHARRGFVDALKGGDGRAEAVIRMIKRLYAIEAEAKGLDPPDRQKRRESEAIPILSEIEDWLGKHSYLTAIRKTPLGKAIGYALDRWEELSIYTTDGRIPIDNNAVERSIRPATLGRKNWLFAGSPRGARAAALFLTLIDSAKRAGLNTWEYFHDLIARIGDHPINRLEELLPTNWKPANNPTA